MGEFDYIRWIRTRTPTAPGVLVGPGDDCAVLAESKSPCLVTTDMLLEGSHFVLADVGARRVGRKAMAVNLSDIAAMGGKPVAAFVSVALPRGEAKAVGEELDAGMRELADRFEVTIAGGDTNTWRGGLVVSVTLLGEPGPQGPILRRGARPGDWLLVTGPLGGSILGKHLDFTPRVKEGLSLQEHAAIHAMIDISDGLAADAFHICEESGCGLVLFADRIPISDAARGMNDGKPPLDHALGDGEDFELAFAVSAADGARLLQLQPIAGIVLSHAGEFISEEKLFLEAGGTRNRIAPSGFVHAFGPTGRDA
jgi:thiamine-monophosphate kinase